MNDMHNGKGEDFLDRISGALRENGLVDRGEMVLIACSGGVDSMVLLDVMDRLGKENRFSVAAAHLDHSLRGPEGGKDQELVARTCRERKIPFVGGREDVRSYCDRERLSLQEGARRIRYTFLEESLEKIGGDKVATAHHADDQVETVLMRLMRGTGPAGLRGIPINRDGRIIRPFLSEWKADIVTYAQECRLSYREDSGNRGCEFQRNRIRNELIPSLEAYNPKVRESLFHCSRLIAEEGEAFDRFVDETLRRIEFKNVGAEITMDRESLLTCHPFVIKEIIRRALQVLRSEYGPDYKNLALALDFVREAESGRRMELPGGRVMGRDFDEIFLRAEPVHDRDDDGRAIEMEVPIERSARFEFRPGEESWTVQVELLAGDRVGDPAGNTTHQFFDRERIRPPVTLRKWRPGDTLDPFGMKGRKKVSDLLAEEKVARRKREHVILLEDRKSILWVVGVRRSRRAMITPGTKEVVSVSVRANSRSGGR